MVTKRVECVFQRRDFCVCFSVNLTFSLLGGRCGASTMVSACESFIHFQPTKQDSKHGWHAAIQLTEWVPGRRYTLIWRQCTLTSPASTSTATVVLPSSSTDRIVFVLPTDAPPAVLRPCCSGRRGAAALSRDAVVHCDCGRVTSAASTASATAAIARRAATLAAVLARRIVRGADGGHGARGPALDCAGVAANMAGRSTRNS